MLMGVYHQKVLEEDDAHQVANGRNFQMTTAEVFGNYQASWAHSRYCATEVDLHNSARSMSTSMSCGKARGEDQIQPPLALALLTQISLALGFK